MSLPPDIVEGKFEVLHKISEGGMGAVYKVRHILLDQPFVIKVIRSQLEGDENLRQRFLREAQAASRLREHPNIAGVHDFSIGSDGTAYIVMEFIDGSTLKQILARSGPPPLPLTMEIAHQSLMALSFLHQQGYIHRDISPDNLMLTKAFDGKPLVKLIDLGLTKRLGASGELTTEGAFLGKVRYSAPEQFNNRVLDARSDLYSFGVMLYELLTGRRPIEGEEFTALVAGHLFHEPLAFDVADPQGRVPAELRRVVLKTLAKNPDQRVASADELASSLEPFRQPASIAGEDVERTIALAHEPRVTLPVAPLAEQPAAASATAGSAALASAGASLDKTAATDLRPDRDAPVKRWPVWVAAAAAMALAAVGLWRYFPGGPTFIEIPPAQKSYQLAMEAIAGEDWPAAGTYLDEALELDPAEQARPRWANPDWDGPYLPHYYRGVAHLRRYSCSLAAREWQESERQGAIQGTPAYQDLLEKRRECQAEFDDNLAAIQGAFDEAAAVADLLAPALENPDLASLWQESPELATSVRLALQQREDLRRRLAGVGEGQDFKELFELDEGVARLKEDLDGLVREVLGQG